MTTWFSTRGRAEEFSARVDGSLPGPRRRADPATERLLELVRTLQTQGSLEPSATPREAFSRDLRDRLMAEAPSVLVAEQPAQAAGAVVSVPGVRRRGRERRLVAAATAAAVLGGGLGVATAAQSSLPGDTLYPLKRTLERTDVILSSSPAARGRDLLDHASRRLDEASALLAERDGTSTALVPGTLQAFTAEGRQGADLLLGGYRTDQGPASVLTVRRFASASYEALDRLSDAAPSGARPAIAQAKRMLGDIDAQASALCGTCADLPALPPSTTSGASGASGETARSRADLNAVKLEKSRPGVVKVPTRKALERAAAPAAPASAPDVAPASVPEHASPQRNPAPVPTPAAPPPTADVVLSPPEVPTAAPRMRTAAPLARPSSGRSAGSFSGPLAVPSTLPSSAPSSAPSTGPLAGPLTKPLPKGSSSAVLPKPTAVPKAPEATALLPEAPALTGGSTGRLDQ